MKNLCLYLLLAFTSFSSLYSQNYSVSSIPDSLKPNAYLVVREDIRDLEISAPNKATEKILSVYTVFNEKGEDMAILGLSYDKNQSIRIREITYFDSEGKKIKTAKQSDITDTPANGSSQLFSDNRVKIYRPGQPVYPYTVKYEYEIDFDNNISFAVWHPFYNYNISTQLCQLTIRHPAKIKINKKEINISPVKSDVKSEIYTETWELRDFKAIEEEPFSVNFNERIPSVYLTPSSLIYDKYKGTSDDWNDYGKWAYSLYNGRDNFTDAEKSKLDALISNVPDTLGRIKVLYKYLQETTRYVNIKLGLGGYQPFDASAVFETGYGDCKALTNFLHSMLKYAGIKSFPALVSSGRYKESIFHDFPNFQQFDHVILCVPQPHDTIWLECTDQKIPFGFLGDFTDNRDVLLITESGGKFAHTKKYDLKDNSRSCRTEISIDSTGAALFNINTTYTGLSYDGISDLLYSNYDEQKKWLYSTATLPSFELKNFSINEFKNILPSATVNEKGCSKNYCVFSGKYMILPLNVLNSQKSIQKMLKQRNSDIIINRSSIDYDTIVFKTPKNFVYESLPAGNNFKSDFGTYSCSITANEKGIMFIRKFTILEGHYKSSYYKELYDFILSVSKSDNVKILLTRKS